MKKVDITALIAAAKTNTSGDVVTWDELSAILIQLNTDINTLTYSGAIEFTQNYTDYGTVNVSGAMTIVKTTTGAVAGTSSILRLVANGTNIPVLTAWKEMTGSSGYDNRSGITNTLVFFFDGSSYWVNIFQEVGATPIDLVAPTLVSAVVSNANTSRVVLTYSETLDSGSVPATSAFAISGKTISAVSISGTVVNVDVSVAFASGDTIAISYTSPTSGKIRDIAANNAANLTAQAVTNSVGGTLANVPWTTLSNVAVAGSYLNCTTAASGATGGWSSAITPSSGFECVFDVESANQAAIVIALDATLDSNYAWDGTNAFIAGAYFAGGTLNRCVSGAGYTSLGSYSAPFKVKFKKVGNDLLLYSSTDLINYTLQYTFTGALTGISTLYIKALYAAPSTSQTIKVQYIA